VEEGNWWDQGIRFECQGSGKCCVSHGGYGYVYMTKEDRIRMAKTLGLSTQQFTKKYCVKQEDGLYHLIDGEEGRCFFLEDKRCGVYEGRPTQCRTWPFWPEVMNAKTWQREVAQFCPGVGQGKLWSKEEIKAQLQIQEKSEA
jgi:Fe-S-cluster containining protein